MENGILEVKQLAGVSQLSRGRAETYEQAHHLEGGTATFTRAKPGKKWKRRIF